MDLDDSAPVGPPIDPHALVCIVLSALTLQAYEWCLTANDEFQCIWVKRWTSFTAYWVAVRYLPLIGRTLNAAALLGLPLGTQTHVRFDLAVIVIMGMSVCLGHLGLLMRAHILWGRRRAVTFFPFLLWLIETVLNVVPIFDPSLVGIIVTGNPKCVLWSVGRDGNLFLMMVISCELAFDCAVTGLVALRCIWLKRQHSSHPLVDILLKDGIGYFAIVLVLNTLNVTFIRTCLDPSLTFTILSISATLPNLIITRMILGLRAYDSEPPPAADDLPAIYPERSIRLTAPFGLNTLLDAFQRPYEFPAPAQLHDVHRMHPRAVPG